MSSLQLYGGENEVTLYTGVTGDFKLEETGQRFMKEPY